jgi:hypothetical protein
MKAHMQSEATQNNPSTASSYQTPHQYSRTEIQSLLLNGLRKIKAIKTAPVQTAQKGVSTTTSRTESRSANIFRYYVQMAVEHMGKGKELAGNWPLQVFEGVANTLAKLNCDPKVLQAFEFCEEVTRRTESLLTASLQQKKDPSVFSTGAEKISAFITTHVKQLKVGEGLIVPVITGGHQMLLYVQRTKADEGMQGGLFSATLWNTGPGLLEYHYKREVHETTEFQIAHEIVDIPESNLCDKTFFKDLVLSRREAGKQAICRIYETFLPNLGGKKTEKSTNRHFWDRAQVGRSCTAKSSKALLRTLLPKKEFENFKDYTQGMLVLLSWEQITGGREEFPGEQKTVTLEAVKKLSRRLKKSTGMIPPELQALENDLKLMLKKGQQSVLQSIEVEKAQKRAQKDPVSLSMTINKIPTILTVDRQGTVSSNSLADNLNIAFDVITKAPPGSNQKMAQPFFDKVSLLIGEAYTSESPMPKTESAKLSAVCKTISDYFTEHPIPLEQLEGIRDIAITLCLLESIPGMDSEHRKWFIANKEEIESFRNEVSFSCEQLQVLEKKR